jgi:hypothetical protein
MFDIGRHVRKRWRIEDLLQPHVDLECLTDAA